MGKKLTPCCFSHEYTLSVHSLTYFSAQSFGHLASESNSANDCQSFKAKSGLSFIPVLRCKGEFTKNIPPKDNFAKPPNRSTSALSSKRTFLPLLSNSRAVS